MSALVVVAVFISGLAIGGIIERWRWLRSPAAREWEQQTGERGKLL